MPAMRGTQSETAVAFVIRTSMLNMAAGGGWSPE